MYYYQIIGFGSCIWCQRANQLASQEQLPYVASWIENSPDLLEWYKTNYGMKTVPIVLKLHTGGVSFEIIGGYTDFKEYIDQGLHLESDKDAE
jgi:glutaredoxin